MRVVTRRAHVAAMLLALILSGCSHPAGDEDGEGTTTDAEVPVRLARLELRRFEDAVEAPGQWRSAGERIVASPFSGVVDSLRVQVGDVVHAGQLVGTLTTLESRALLKGAALMAREAGDAAARAEAERALEIARRDRVHVPLASPAAGVVVRRSAEPESQVAEGAEILAIAPTDRLVFEARVAARDAPRIRTGQAAEVREEGAPPRAAVVQRVLPATDSADQTTPVWLSSAGGAGPPRLGRFGTASIAVGAPREAPAVPDSAVVEDDLTGETRVAVIDAASRSHWTQVELGTSSGGWRELRSPRLVPGTRVVVEGQRGLPDSTRVKAGP